LAFSELGRDGVADERAVEKLDESRAAVGRRVVRIADAVLINVLALFLLGCDALLARQRLGWRHANGHQERGEREALSGSSWWSRRRLWNEAHREPLLLLLQWCWARTPSSDQRAPVLNLKQRIRRYGGILPSFELGVYGTGWQVECDILGHFF
jgi:hypothetical protein